MIAFPLCYGVKCGLIFDVRSHELVTHLRVCRDQSLVYHRFRLREFSRYIYIYIWRSKTAQPLQVPISEVSAT
ncbi:MAG: hypothetical protein QOG73_732 [Acetobacteraceae bacterium]|nr:hypothetical protein [Acetobacteraceae bacterium]